MKSFFEGLARGQKLQSTDFAGDIYPIGVRRQMSKKKLQRLVKDCQQELAKYLVPNSGISDREVINALLQRLDGPQAMEALK